MRRGILLAVSALLLGAPSLALAQAETPKLEQLISDHSFLVVSINDMNKTRAECARTAMAKLWREPEVQEFLAPALRLLKKEMRKAERELGHPISGLLDYFQGQAALAVVEFDPMTMGMIPDLVLLVDLGEQRAKFQAVHEAAVEKYATSLSIENLGYKGVNYQTLTVDMGVEISMGYLGNAFVVTLLPERMTAMIDAWQGQARTRLSDNATFRNVMARTGGKGAFLSAFVNVESIMATFGDMMDPETSRMVDEFGLSGVKALGYGGSFVEEGVRDSFFAYVPGEKKGIIELMYTAPGDATTLLSRVPKNAFYANAFGLDLDRLGDAALKMVGRMQPYALDQIMGMMAQAEDFLGLDIRADLLRPFGKVHALYAAMPAGGGLVPDLVFLTKLREPDRFMESMSQVVGKLRMFLEDDPRLKVHLRQMSFKGRTIYYIYVAHKWGDPFPVTPTCVLDGDVLAMGLVPNTIKDWVAGGSGAPSILERPDFVRARQGLPEDIDSIEYLDFQAGVRLIYGTLAPIAQLAAKSAKCPMDMALLPRTETIAKHFFGGISGMKAGEDGISLHSYSPTGILPFVAVMGAGMATFVMGGGEAPATFEFPEGPDVETAPEPRPEVVKPPRPEPVRVRGAKAALEEIYIGLLFHYAQTDSYAGNLGELVESRALEGAGALQVAGDNKAPKVGDYPCSFVYVGPKVGNILENADQAVWVYTRDGLGAKRWVLFASGEVRQVAEGDFRKLLAGTRTVLKDK